MRILEAQAEKIKELKKLLTNQRKKLAELKNIIKGIAKDVSSTKNTSKKAESITSHFTLLHFLSRQVSFKTNDTRAPLFSSSKSTGVGPQIA